jgi:hypothetical protein
VNPDLPGDEKRARAPPALTVATKVLEARELATRLLLPPPAPLRPLLLLRALPLPCFEEPLLPVLRVCVFSYIAPLCALRYQLSLSLSLPPPLSSSLFSLLSSLFSLSLSLSLSLASSVSLAHSRSLCMYMHTYMHRERGMPQGAKSQLAHRVFLPLIQMRESTFAPLLLYLTQPPPLKASVLSRLPSSCVCIFVLARVCKKART